MDTELFGKFGNLAAACTSSKQALNLSIVQMVLSLTLIGWSISGLMGCERLALEPLEKRA